ncbi:D-alanyl-D-alanine carboxypeptidase/D-alanyl-D-alanine-endopeptidase [Stanieria sp. NIES-3757]|nr:D-alanyl-D-alanine carboxypeptidase/D-alanyl-D-alanine-endopeptidase [Stanieria sp. NIES-3757]
MFWAKSGWLLILFLGIPSLATITWAKEPEKLVEHSPENVCPQDLPFAIEKIINRPQFSHAHWGILIQSVSGQTFYNHNAKKYFIPASNAKILTTAAALQELGADFRIETPIYITGKLPHLNSLKLVGRGDPTITVNTLNRIAKLGRDRGIKSIRNLVVDDSYFKESNLNYTWEWSDLYSYYATGVNSLILNQNTFTLSLRPQQLNQPVKLTWSDWIAYRQWRIENYATTATKDTAYQIKLEGILGQPVLRISGQLAIDSQPDVWDLAVVDPANYFLESFRLVLFNQGIVVARGTVLTERRQPQLETKFATIYSPPLQEILTQINQDSNNLFAEAILKILGKKLNSNSDVDAIQASLTQLGVDPQSYILVDGSGLSRHNLVTPEALVQTLRLMMKTSEADVYRSSLAVAGVNGTLANRFQNTSVQNHFQGKTGTLSGIAALSGYLEVKDYQPLVISIIVNNSNLANSNLRQAIDEIVILLSKLHYC